MNKLEGVWPRWSSCYVCKDVTRCCLYHRIRRCVNFGWYWVLLMSESLCADVSEDVKQSDNMQVAPPDAVLKQQENMQVAAPNTANNQV